MTGGETKRSLMIEDEPWIGPSYGSGLLGAQRIAIVGWSHHADEGDEASGILNGKGTIHCIERVMSGEWRIRFFTQIRDYFEYDQHAVFWPQVIFLNYLPTAVPTADKFSHGNLEQRLDAPDRFRRLLRLHKSKRVLIFSRRDWAFNWAFPEAQNLFHKLGSEFPDTFGYRLYERGLPIFFLRHPQGASKVMMRRAIERILSEPNVGAEVEGSHTPDLKDG